MKNVILLSLLLILFFGCVSKSEHEVVIRENKMLKKLTKELVHELDSIKSVSNSHRIICDKEMVYKELESYLEFYCPDCMFKDFKIRQIDDCIFDINIKKKSKDNQPYPNWITVIVRMTFGSDGKFTVEDVEGSHRWACDGL